MEFHNSNIEIARVFYNSHESIIRLVCEELDQNDKVDELIEKLLVKTFVKQKQMKDPNRPKKPMTAYMLFCNDNRDAIRKKNPDAKLGDVSKLLAEKWGKVSEKDKKKFNDKAEEEREKYENEMINYKCKN